MNRILCLSLLLLTFLSGALQGQQESADYLTLGALKNIEPVGLQKINSEQFEFAPVRYKNGLLFVQSKSEKKRIKKNEEIDFKLTFASFDEKGEVQEIVDFPDLRMNGSLEGPCSLSPNGNLLFITRNLTEEKGLGDENELKLGIFIYERKEDGWMLLSEFPFNHTEYNTCHPTWDNESQKIYFASDMPGGFGKLDLYESSRMEDGNWTIPLNLGPAINGYSNDCFPNIHKQKFLFYSRGQHNKAADLNIYCSVKESNSWLRPQVLPENINSEMDDLSWFMDFDGSTAYFASSRLGGEGQDDIYRIDIPEEFLSEPGILHQLEVYDISTGKGIAACNVKFISFDKNQPILEDFDGNRVLLNYNSKTDELTNGEQFTTNSAGELSFEIERGEYILQLKKENYYTHHKLMLLTQNEGIYRLGLEPQTCRNVSFNFFDKKSGQALDGVRIRTENENISKLERNSSMKYCFYKNEEAKFTFELDGYQGNSQLISYNNLKIDNRMEIFLDPSSAYVEAFPLNTGEVFVLKDILYLFDQFRLNAKAKSELDKLAKHLKSNPKVTIELSSHTCSRGKEIYNQMLSDKRAGNARKYLIDQGVEAYRIAAIGYGESRLLNHCSDKEKCSEEEHSINRRTEIKVLTH